jgi:dynein heavy chain, axonemal
LKKSECIPRHTLTLTLLCSQRVRYEILNPKCITMGELYGEFNKMTQEWHDGLASTIMRRAVSDDTLDKKWTVFDGPIDALWIENMNTVLDDNMTLCLANGERIKLKIEMKMLFEVMDLAVASPATVSRIGVVYMTPTDLGWYPYIQSWVVRDLASYVSANVRQRLLTLFEKVMDKGLKFQRKNCKEPVSCVDIQLATSLALLFQSLFKPERGVNFSKPEDELLKLVDRIFAFSFFWSVGGSINYPFWEKFDEFTRELFDSEGIQLQLPPTGLIFDYMVDIPNNQFTSWNSTVPAFSYIEGMPYFQMVVPTVDTVRFSYLMSTCIAVDKPVFVTGVTGTGKTIVVQTLLKGLAPPKEEGGQNVLGVNISFSAQTNSLITQLTIESKLEKKRKNLLGAPAGKKVIIFVDDVNMPFVEEYGAQPPIELLRQFLDFKGFYDRDKLFWKDIQDTLLFAGAAPPGGGRNFVTPRFVRHFNVLCMPAASDSTMFVIFQSILTGFMAKGFDSEIKKMVDGVVNATIEVYNRISLELLPTPAKFHYTFNLRDISKVFQGILMIKPQKCQTVDVAMRLWLHECMRVFYDRLINLDDQAWFKDLSMELIQRFLRLSVQKEDLFDKQPIIFCDFLKPGAEIKFYETASDMNKLQTLLNDYLDEYNASFANQMNLVFFTDAIVHTARIARIIRQPRGNAMLVGVGGSGKQSLTRIASFIAGYACIQIEINRGYGLDQFREDIKKMMIKAGVGGNHTVFLFTDSQIVVESMLEDINNVLNSGEIPNLFPQDEMDKIVGDMIPVMKELGLPESRDNCIAQFIMRLRDFLHIVLCMSPVGDALRVRCRQFPSLINCTTIDWFMGWPKSALVQVAQKFLATIPLPNEEVRGALVEMCGTVHTSITDAAARFFDELRRMVYVTPKSYLDLINLYSGMLGGLQGEVDKKMERMTIGVRKLDETNAMVEGLKEDLKALEPVLVEKSAAAEKLLKQVAVDQAEAAIIKEKVSKEAAEVNRQAAEVGEVQAEAQKDLDAALPALNSAIKALDSISKSDITIVKTFTSPPPLVKTVMESVCIMFDMKPDWDSSKKLLGDSQFLDKLKTYDKDNIDEKLLRKIKPYLDNPDFNTESVKKVSSAAAGLCMWVGAMDVYARVAKDVEPKKQRLAEMNRVLNAANATLAVKMGELQKVVDKVEGLQRLCNITVAEKDQLARDTETTANRLVRAEKLTSGLASEGVRWRATLLELAAQKTDLIGDTFLSCACVSYYGPFTGLYRDTLVDGWLTTARELSIPCSPNYSMIRTLGDPVQIREWQNYGLPSDAVSTNNAILVTKGRRWPLMIDPQMQANKWIRKMEEKAFLDVTVMTNVNLLRSLENCIRVGKPLLIEDVGEQLEPALEPVLLKAVYKQGTRLLIRLGDQEVDYDSQFRLYMTSKMPNPHYLPEVCIKVTVINFTVTSQGLEDQLLGEVVKLERPGGYMALSTCLSCLVTLTRTCLMPGRHRGQEGSAAAAHGGG